ncbi:hypothetical protein [Pseudovibrio sp. Ad37]|uniref:hypothetical protein n=1 Tax=Pseudovibrio sp. Ad37 TaxID=989422 RepID=UPI0007AE515B|nr:hypothetical protein [Pseudovibrio sp. Ad37]KZL24247.1 hypothetical protein PsAD37_02818 [Pseudovibrio sp. Ad37]
MVLATHNGSEFQKWACITLHKWLPSKAQQIAGARAWGAHNDWLSGIEEVPTTFTDDIRDVKTTRWGDDRWPAKLPNRATLIHALSKSEIPLDQVYFRSPLCVGISQKLALATINAIWDAKALVYVQTMDVLYKAGDDLEDFCTQLRKDIKASQNKDQRRRHPEG